MSTVDVRDRVLRWTAPAILLLVAAAQAYQVRVHDLTPWKGGGFGMFSTVDNPRRRIVRCYLVGEDGRDTPLRIPPKFERETWEVRSIPTSERLSALAHALAADFNQSMAKAGRAVSARQLRVEVWRVAFDSQRHTLTPSKVREAIVER
jgi:hypothetical protein